MVPVTARELAMLTASMNADSPVTASVEEAVIDDAEIGPTIVSWPAISSVDDSVTAAVATSVELSVVTPVTASVEESLAALVTASAQSALTPSVGAEVPVTTRSLFMAMLPVSVVVPATARVLDMLTASVKADAPMTASSEEAVIDVAKIVPIAMSWPITTSVDVGDAAPVTAGVELSVAAPVAASVEEKLAGPAPPPRGPTRTARRVRSLRRWAMRRR
eukprot:NODE_728_length_1390_cov_185.354307.p2 GENE.NODE_728_length_1390_cov_185.354307~~NODE_728_length_1390_cov_185.354307.p2  ORF type:complete len:219 (+),score=39.81 NODE_728_length_1390_cov_185.354307:471-1127(+)